MTKPDNPVLTEVKSAIRDVREDSPVFYLEPQDWLRIEGSSPLPVQQIPGCAKEPYTTTDIPEVIVSGAPNPPESVYQSPAKVPTRNTVVTPDLGPEEAVLRRKQKFRGSKSTGKLNIKEDAYLSGSGSFLFGDARNCPEPRQRKIAIPILCARAAAMVSLYLFK